VEAGGTLVSYDIDPRLIDEARQNIGLPDGDPRWGSWRFLVKSSLDAPADWWDGSIGLFFLDTTHSYEDTRRELAEWLPKMHPSGVMCGHDYLAPAGVKPAVDEMVARCPNRFSLQVLRYDQGLFILWPRQ
jgi:predicted O-methyltransferase YrrM